MSPNLKQQRVKLVKGINTIQVNTAELPAIRFWLNLKTRKDDQEALEFLQQ